MDRFPRANFLLASTCRTHRGTDRITNQYDNGFIPVEVDCSPQDSSKASGTFSAFFLTYLRTASCCGVLGCDTVPRCAGMWHCTAVCWDVTPYRGVLGCDTVPWCAGMLHCTVVCWDVTLYFETTSTVSLWEPSASIFLLLRRWRRYGSLKHWYPSTRHNPTAWKIFM